MKNWKNLAGAAIIGAAASIAHGQWSFECIDPNNTAPFSADWNITFLNDRLAAIAVGLGGTVTYGGTAGPCYNPSVSMQAQGSFAFGAGSEGSVQTPLDDNMAYTMGWDRGPSAEPAGDFTYARLTSGTDLSTSAVFGSGGYSSAFTGASKRYGVVIWDGAVNGTNVEVELQYRIIGDAVRMRWRVFNQSTADASIGLDWGMTPAMHLANGQTDATGFNMANTRFSTNQNPGGGKYIDGYTGFTMLSNRKPLRLEKKFLLTNPDYPAYIKTLFGQEDNIGMFLPNSTIPGINDADSTDMFIFANRETILTDGDDNNKTMATNLFGDPTGLVTENDIAVGEPAVLQEYPQKLIPANTSRDFVFYIRSNWSQGFYLDPYTLLIDAPATLNYEGVLTGNAHSPSPMTIGAWLDNQYADVDKSIDMSSVRFTLDLGTGLSFDPSDPNFASAQRDPVTNHWKIVKTLPRIRANELGNVTWQVQSDGVTFGDLPITLTAETIPGPTRSITKTIRVAASPTYTFSPGSNLVTIPYTLGDSSLDSTLGLLSGRDYVAYAWDPGLRGYVPTTSAQRGRAFWLVPTTGNLGQRTLNNASYPADSNSGGLLISLQSGWNLIGNPYNYPIKLGQIVGVAEDTPENALTWHQLVQSGFVNSSLSYWQADTALPDGGSYQFISGDDQNLEPHVGYWVFVNTFSPVRLSMPPVYQEQLIDAGRSARTSPIWRNTDRQWRLQLSARSANGFDSTNYVGVTTDNKKAQLLEIPKPPMPPNGKLEMAVVDPNAKSQSRLAQSFTDRIAKKDWQIEVHAKEAGDVTVTWPNVASLPRNVRFTVTDPISGQRFDLRSQSGYTFKMAQPGTRELTLTMEPGGSVRPVIGDVQVTRSGRDISGPVTISYSLSADALVSVRILAANGKEIYTVSRGRADGTGQNSVTWMLRDSANRSVAPGTYKVEILAETPSGERVRKIVPVNVIR